MEKSDKVNEIVTFLKAQTLGVVSTINKNGTPESALVSFCETTELELIFGTLSDSRKFANLQGNKNVSFVISEKAKTLQYEGVARIADESEAEKLRALQLAKNPPSKKYAFDPKQRYIVITPTWIRFSDFSTNPEQILEIDL